MDFKDESAEMATTDALLLNKMDGALVVAMSNELNSGFSTPPSSSLDTCDSGFTELYSNNFTLINSTKQIIEKQPDMQSLSSTTSETMNFGDSDLELNSITPPVCPSTQSTKKGKTSAGNAKNHVDHIDNTNISDEQNDENVEINSSIDENGYADDESDDFDDAESNSSDMSDLSDVFKLNSDIAPEMQRSLNWVHLQIASGVNPRECLSRIFINSSKAAIPENISDNDLWRVIAAILSDPPRRSRLQHIKSIEDVASTIAKSKNIIVLTGAGVSVSCGIPDFRSRNGIYERLRVEYPEMRDPQSMFDIAFFAQDPRPFYQFAREIYPGLFEPSPSHRFIKLLERSGKLLRNYTQNIDTLERVAGIENIIECHGSFATASCTRCKYKVEAAVIRDDILQQRIPMCPICNDNVDGDKVNANNDTLQKPLNYNQLVAAGIMKPDIVFFGESLPEKFHSTIEMDKTKCDLLIVIGSSLKVRPVALIPSSIAPDIPQILINREKLDQFAFDVELLGNSDEIINQLCYILGNDWTELCSKPKLNLVTELLPPPSPSSSTSDSANDDESSINKIVEAKSAEKLTADNATSTTAMNVNELNDTLNETNASNVPNLNKVHTDNQDEEIAKTDSNIIVDEDDIQLLKYSRKSTPVESLADLLPANSYFYNGKISYIFPGAEIFLTDSDDNDDDDSTSTSDSEDSTSSLRKQYELNATALCTDSPRSEKSQDIQLTLGDDCNSLDVCNSSRSKSPSLLPENEATMLLPKTELLSEDLNINIDKIIVATSEESCHNSGSPRTKRTSIDMVDSLVLNSDLDEHVVAQKRCKYSSD